MFSPRRCQGTRTLKKRLNFPTISYNIEMYFIVGGSFMNRPFLIYYLVYGRFMPAFKNG